MLPKTQTNVKIPSKTYMIVSVSTNHIEYFHS